MYLIYNVDSTISGQLRFYSVFAYLSFLLVFFFFLLHLIAWSF